jgi:hypothetical protein
MNAKHNRSLPKRNGQVVLGQGEVLPTQNANDSKALIGLSKILGKKPFTSWVLTDTETPSSFSIQAGTFQLHSFPYYYFWSRNEDSTTQYQGNVDAFNSRVRAYNLQVTNHKNLVNQFNSLASRFNANNASVPKFTLDGLRFEIEISESKLVALEQELNRLDMDLKEGAVVNSVPALTNALKNQSDLLKEINPVVINAVKATAEYAAFFRYMKFNHPSTWKTFLASIDEVAIHPAVKTPTKMPRKTP